MSNIVRNIIRMEKIGECPLYNEEGDLDFNMLIPMPKDLDTEHPLSIDTFIIYYLTDRLTKTPSLKDIALFYESQEQFQNNLRRTCSIKSYMQDFDYELGKKFAQNKKKYGAATWYSWRINNWGTKWNASECYVDENEVSFIIPWDTPMQIVKKLSELYPESTIEHIWADKFLANCGPWKKKQKRPTMP